MNFFIFNIIIIFTIFIFNIWCDFPETMVEVLSCKHLDTIEDIIITIATIFIHVMIITSPIYFYFS